MKKSRAISNKGTVCGPFTTTIYLQDGMVVVKSGEYPENYARYLAPKGERWVRREFLKDGQWEEYPATKPL